MSAQTDTSSRRNVSVRRRLLGQFTKRSEGVVAVEFALIAAPFFAVLLGIIEAGLFVFASQLMESAMEDTARLIRTGQAKGMTQTQMITDACKRVIIVSQQACEGKAKLEVKVYNGFAAYDPTNLPIDSTGKFLPAIPYENPSALQYVVARLYYPWPTFMPNMGIGGGSMADGSRLIVGTAAFRTENF